jgi:hypothetical protein
MSRDIVMGWLRHLCLLLWLLAVVVCCGCLIWMADCCGWLIAVDDCDPHRRRLRLALPLSKLGAGQTRVFSTTVFWFSFDTFVDCYGHDELDRFRLVLVLFIIDRPRPPRCPFSLGPAVPALSQYR